MNKGKKFEISLGTERLEAFSDSVFAIVITLLFYNLKTPELNNHEDWREMFDALYKFAPRFVGIVLSFMFVAAFWVSHHQFFRTLKQTTRGLLWLNLVFLFLVCFVPFPAEIMTEHPQNKTAVVFFGATIVLTSVMFSALRYYAWVKHSEISGMISEDHIKKALHRSLLLVGLYVLTLLVAFVFPVVAIVLDVLILGILFFPIKVEVENEEEEDDDDENEKTAVEL